MAYKVFEIHSILEGSVLRLEGKTKRYELINRYSNETVYHAANLMQIRNRIKTILGK